MAKKRREWTAEQKAAQRDRMLAMHEKRNAAAPPSPDKPPRVATPASIKHTSPADVKRMQAEIEELTKKLRVSENKRTDAERNALRLAESQGGFGDEIQEVPTGKFRMVDVLDTDYKDSAGMAPAGFKVVGHKDDNRDILRPVFRKEKVPTYFYKIFLPPSGGKHIVTNGEEYAHNTVYSFTVDQLRDVKSRVWACWKHNTDVHKSDENIYRRPENANAARPGELAARIAEATQRLRG